MDKQQEELPEPEGALAVGKVVGAGTALAIVDCLRRCAVEPNPERLGPLRKIIKTMLRSRVCEVIINVLIAANLILVVGETDSISLGEEVPDWIQITNYLMLIIFSVEVTMRIFIHELAFFCNPWNLMDFSVVALDVFGTAIELIGIEFPSLSVLRVLRLARLVRGAKIVAQFPRLALLVHGCVAAIGTILWGMALVSIIVLLWSILATNLIHPLAEDVDSKGGYEGCSRCPVAYQTVGASMVTILQANICGDSWGSTTIPIIEEYPLSIIFFCVVYMSVQMAILNVIMSVIVDSALKASECNERLVRQQDEEAFAAAYAWCESIDADKSGRVTKDEFLEGVNSAEAKVFLDSLGITQEDVEAAFAIVDADGSGDVAYAEIIHEIQKMKSHDENEKQLVFMRLYFAQVWQRLSREMHCLKTDILPRLHERHNPALKRIAI